MRRLLFWLRALPLLLVSPFLVAVPALLLFACDLAWLAVGRRRTTPETRPFAQAASVVIPNWNGRDLLEKYIPPLLTALAGNPANELIVVDNGSTDGSAEFLRQHFPTVRVIALPQNLGFGGGSNVGFREATHDIVVLLNSDMRVDPGFLQPLLDGFTDERVFAVSCQIFFSDPNRHREETGLTQGAWSRGYLRVRHRDDDQVNALYPCFYGGGGSCAFDRRKVLDLGGFDELLAPFYLEDTDLGYLAWKRGWKVLYEPRSVVFHEHRGTIGKVFSNAHIQGVLKKNFVLFAWKNIHEWRKLAEHFLYGYGDAVLSLFAGDSPERATLAGWARALRQLPQALHSRWRARQLAVVSDTEAFRRPLGGYFRDRFAPLPDEPGRLQVLFLSPYPICPPVHGGGVFMFQTLRELARHCDVHLVALLDHPHEIAAQDELAPYCRTREFMVRMTGKQKVIGSLLPHAVVEFSNDDLRWLLHRQTYLHGIDAVQLEYTNMGQYAEAYDRIGTFLFEHDIYFQSIGRALPRMPGLVRRTSATLEYLRALRFELAAVQRVDRVQVCSRANGDYLASFLPALRGRMDTGLRAGIDTANYPFRLDGREPDTLLFLGSFRHLPNQEALEWFVRSVFPLILERRPTVRLVVIGSDPPARHSLPLQSDRIELRGFVEDVQEPLGRYALFVCPILTGSGVRVKLLEAFSSGMPVISTRIGAEGITERDGELCRLADDPVQFAEAVLALLSDPAEAARMAHEARRVMEAEWDMAVLTRRLAEQFRDTVVRKRRLHGRSQGQPLPGAPSGEGRPTPTDGLTVG